MHMKNNKGVTLMILAVTIIILMIIISVVVVYAKTRVKKIKLDKAIAELSIVQTAVFQRYNLIKAKGETGQIATAINTNTRLNQDTDRPQSMVGTRIANCSELVEDNNIEQDKIINYYDNGTDKSNFTYEDYYYILNVDDLKKLGIDNKYFEDSDTIYEYIVNYSTGEVYDIYITTKDYAEGQEVSTQVSNYTGTEKQYNFIDN